MGGTEELAIASSALTAEETSNLAVCLVSGGMDSCVTVAIAANENDELAFLHASYGQRTADKERQSFEALADYFRVEQRLVITLEHLARIGGSSLTDSTIPVTQADLNSKAIPSSYV